MRRIAISCLAMLALTACADPLRDVPRLSDVEIEDGAGEAKALPDSSETAEGGFFGRLLGGTAKADETEQGRRSAAPDGSIKRAAKAPQDPAPRSGGVFGGLFGGGADPEPEANAPEPGDPDYGQVGPGVTLPYGKMARLCGVPRRVLGKRVASYPERRGTFKLYDTQPGNTAPHTFFLTGFDDGCARQFTAALAMFGSPVLHEQLRYGLPAKVQPYSTTDAAYEKLKSRICRVGKGKPCGSAMRRLEPQTTFVSVYERFGSNPRWKTVLLHDGAVLATDIKN
ncbi:hypothetical protein [Aestuariicoccus sp. MJ-SS9]|uniref:hypothetical protein n=1 Tax=Aestuariicoccus sp. MJ-SS9 TaxID=3079855 RepID=UPI002931C6B9|nr:hypothetical protein [Aestuariicoccus sp. MJ-SS9]